MVIQPWFEESQILLRWHEPNESLLIRADHHGLLQVCLNLARNAHRALEASQSKEFVVIATAEGERVFVRFYNTGSPVAEPEKLFRPFQSLAAGAGLGLYVSRAIVRSFGGDLVYESAKEGSCFTVVLEMADLPFITRPVPVHEEDRRFAS
jgi:C4-dicarboxylate-specific signal transduction histidine kinase